MGSGSFGIVASVVLDVMVVMIFGMSWHTDAYFIAVTIPLVIITLLMLQSTRVVQPLFIKRRHTQGEPEGWNYLNLIMTGGTAVVAAFGAIGVLLSPLLMRLQAAGAPQGETLLATRLSMFLFLILPLSFPVVVMRAALQSLGIFALPGATKFIDNSFKILLLLLLGRKLGVEALIWGTLAGTLVEITLFYLVLRRRGFRYHAIWRFKHPDMVQAYSLMAFPLVGQACAVGVESLTNALGSMLGPGNVTALRLATRIIESFSGLLVGSIVIAAIPTITASVAAWDLKATRKHLQHGLYLLLLVTIPFSVWLGMMNRPLIAVLYQRASFSAADTALVANILLLMIPYLFFRKFPKPAGIAFLCRTKYQDPFIRSHREFSSLCGNQLLFCSCRRSLRRAPWAAIWLYHGSLVLACIVAAPHGKNWLCRSSGCRAQNLRRLPGDGGRDLGREVAGHGPFPWWSHRKNIRLRFAHGPRLGCAASFSLRLASFRSGPPQACHGTWARRPAGLCSFS